MEQAAEKSHESSYVGRKKKFSVDWNDGYAQTSPAACSNAGRQSRIREKTEALLFHSAPSSPVPAVVVAAAFRTDRRKGTVENVRENDVNGAASGGGRASEHVRVIDFENIRLLLVDLLSQSSSSSSAAATYSSSPSMPVEMTLEGTR